MGPNDLSGMTRSWIDALPALLDGDDGPFARSRVFPYAFRHSYAQRHVDHGTPVEVLRELMGHTSMVTTQGYFHVREERARKAAQTLAPLQIDRHGTRTMPVVAQLLESERLRRQVGQIAVPLGSCTEPSNVKARGQGCACRYRCVGCEHFRTDPSNQAELREYLHQLLAGRERLAAAIPQLAEWARRDATPSDGEIHAVRALVRRNDQIIDELDPADRAAVLEAIATTHAAPAPRQRHAVTVGPGEAMVAHRRLDSQVKRERVAAATQARLAAGDELTIAAIARHAGVSRKFIYAHPDLRAQIEHRALQATARSTSSAVADSRVTVASLRADLANGKAHSHRLGQQVRALKQRLSLTLGRELAEQLGPDDHAELPDDLRAQLQAAHAQTFEIREQLADAREVLDAVREINRELLADRNRPPR